MKLTMPEVSLSKVKFSYYQISDSCQKEDIGQELIVETDDAGGGPFIILKTDRWAIDSESIDEFCDLLKNIVRIVEENEIK